MVDEVALLKRAQELFIYDPETGEFTWRVAKLPCTKAGTPAGSMCGLGYHILSFDARRYKAHRIAWLLTHGRLPRKQIDHINGDRADNRIANLRECTSAENQQNARVYKSNTSGHPGVSARKDSRWQARIKVNGRDVYLGLFDKYEDACAAYIKAKAEYHTFNPTLSGRHE